MPIPTKGRIARSLSWSQDHIQLMQPMTDRDRTSREAHGLHVQVVLTHAPRLQHHPTSLACCTCTASVQTTVRHTYVHTHTYRHDAFNSRVPSTEKWAAREREEELGRWKVLFRWFEFRLKFFTARAKIQFHKKPVLKGQVVTGSVLSTSQMWPNLQ